MDELDKRVGFIGTPEYGEVYARLILETAIVVFKKANGKVRVMLCTRNTDTATMIWKEGNIGYSLYGFDKRCNRGNKNLAVVDLILGECRSFNTDRVLALKWYGEIKDGDELERVVDEYTKIEADFSKDLGYSAMGGEESNRGSSVQAIEF